MKLSTGPEILVIPSVKDILTKDQKALWERWIVALRSGKYQQARRDLCNASGFSCLGVAADLMVDGEMLKWSPLHNGSRNLLSRDNVTCISYLPPEVSRQLGIVGFGKRNLTENDFHIVTAGTGSYERITLQQLNELGVKFVEIASILEWALEGGYVAPSEK